VTKIIGILVCNSEKVLRHKQQDGKRKDGIYCYWEMTRFPKQILALFPPPFESTGSYSETAAAPRTDWDYDKDDKTFPSDVEIRLYFAVKGLIKGYFICKAMGERHRVNELRFHSEDWHPVSKLTPIKPSQGFRYFKHEEGAES